jgi:hypothetical protein
MSDSLCKFFLISSGIEEHTADLLQHTSNYKLMGGKGNTVILQSTSRVAAMKRLNKVISLLIFEVTAVIKPYFAMDEMSIKAFFRFCSPKQARSHRTVIFALIFL